MFRSQDEKERYLVEGLVTGVEERIVALQKYTEMVFRLAGNTKRMWGESQADFIVGGFCLFLQLREFRIGHGSRQTPSFGVILSTMKGDCPSLCIVERVTPKGSVYPKLWLI